MKLVILDGTTPNLPVAEHLLAVAALAGAEVEHFTLVESRLAPCLGDFECWIKTPGLCRTQDGINDIMQALHTADLAVFLTPIVFGGYSVELKKAVDRQIGLVQPFFHDRDGLTRHVARYRRYARLLFIGVRQGTDEAAADTFRELTAGNAINLLAPSFQTRIVALDDARWAGETEAALLAGLHGTASDPLPPIDRAALFRACAPDSTLAAATQPVKTVAVLIGSARPKGSSTSESLARALIADLEKGGAEVSLVFASQFIKPGRMADAALATMLKADLLVISTPLYVDGLPALVTRALDWLAQRLGQESHALRAVAGLLNSGYPEAVHNRIAMRLLRNFARESGLGWAGGLALGGGEIIHGRPLTDVRWLARRPSRALRLAGQALAAGQGIPEAAIQLMARPLVPSWLFRLVARVRWLRHGRRHGVDGQALVAQTFVALAEPEKVGD